MLHINIHNIFPDVTDIEFDRNKMDLLIIDNKVPQNIPPNKQLLFSVSCAMDIIKP
jgi:hypothetical protein